MDMLDPQSILMRLTLYVPVLILSLTVHEFAHAWSAWLLGDDTAEREGRMTLNPLAHIDPVGTLLLPALGVPFGWAKPVPVRPARFRRGVNMATGMMLTSVAGPASNLVLATVSAVIYGLMKRWAPETLMTHEALGAFLGAMLQVNVALALFNMLPLPPLDGSRVVEWLLPYRFRGAWERVAQLAPFLLLALLVINNRTHFLSGPIQWAAGWMWWLADGLALAG